MNRSRLFLSLLLLTATIILDSCSSGKSAYEQGNYYESVMTSVNRLRRNTDHKKSVETLRHAYPLAVRYYEDQASHVLASQNAFKWTSVVQSYTMINQMHDEIKRSPGALQVIPNPANYYSKLDEAKRNAAEENYQAGILALTLGSRDKAKEAYSLFKKANNFVVGYKEVNSYMEQALLAATVKVMVTPIPVTRNVAWSAEFFNDKISEFLHSAPIDEFVRFYSPQEIQTLKLNPDHIVQLAFDEFAVGQVSLHEKQIQLEKDSVVMGSYIASTTPVSTNNTTNTKTFPSTNTTPKEQTNSNTGSTGNTNTGNIENTNATPPSNSGSQGNQNQQKVESTTPLSNNGNQNSQDNNGGNEKEKNKNTEDKAEDKVTVCHKPPGNTTNTQTLILPLSAVQAHLDHGDAIGFCEEPKKPNKAGENKGNNKTGSNKTNSDANYGSLIQNNNQILLASTETKAWMLGNNFNEWNISSDTVTIYGKVKATYYHFQKTITSKGIVSFRIIDAKSKAILSAEKMPGQFVWISEWATFNGDERALTPLQLEIAQQRERVPPGVQDLFIAFTQPIYSQITGKIQNFYKGY